MSPTPDRLALLSGALLGLVAVVLGALAAHGPLHDFLEGHGHLDPWKTAVSYQWYHALGLIAVGPLPYPRRATVILWLAGVFCFCGSLYLLALDPSQKWAGPVTPLGGLLLIAGWGWLVVTLLRHPSPSPVDSR